MEILGALVIIGLLAIIALALASFLVKLILFGLVVVVIVGLIMFGSQIFWGLLIIVFLVSGTAQIVQYRNYKKIEKERRGFK